jgi:hypothetical protein
MDHSVKLTLDQETRSVKIGRGVTPECFLSPFLFNFYSEYLTKEALEGFGGFKTEVIRAIKIQMTLCYWLRKTRLIKIGGCHGMGMNVKKTKVMRTSRQPSPIQMTDQKHPENVEYFTYLGSIIIIIINDESKNESRIDMTKAPFNTRKTLVTNKLD